MASGDLDQIVETSNIRELNTLSNFLNYLVEQLCGSFKDSEESKEALENRVKKHTTELKVL